MNKIAKYLILLGLALIFISIIFSIRNIESLWEPFYRNAWETNTKYITRDNLEEILVNTRNLRVEIRSYEGESVRITYPKNEREPIVIEENNGTLSLSNQDRSLHRRGWININFNFQIPEVIIEIPEDLILSYNIMTTNARIIVDEVMIQESSFRSSNGAVALTNVRAESNLDVGSSNGRIYLTNIEVARVNANTTNGRIIANNVSGDSVIFTTTNGHIEAIMVQGETIDFTTTNARISLDDLNGTWIELRNSNGRIEGTIIGSLDDFQQDIRTTNGRITIDGENMGSSIRHTGDREKNLNIRTTNSHINLNFR